MPRVGFEPTIPAFERAKTVHALDRAETVIVSSEDLIPVPWNGQRTSRNVHIEEDQEKAANVSVTGSPSVLHTRIPNRIYYDR
jgi:hypothetical protein